MKVMHKTIFAAVGIAIFFTFFTPVAEAFTIGKPGVNNLGLVGHWTFDGRDITNGRIDDASGNGNHGSAVNIATSTFYRPGQVGQAGNFDGVDDNVSTTYNGQLTDFTVCAWFKANDTTPTSYQRIVDKSYSAGMWIGARDGVANSWGGGVLDTSAPYGRYITLPAGQWHHLCSKRDGTTHTIIGNGGAVSTSGTVSSTALNSTVLRIGISNASTAFFSGLIDDVRIYSRALTSAEITALYNSGVAKMGATTRGGAGTTLSNGLVGHWTFDGKDMLTGQARDVSGNGNHGSLVNMATSTSRAFGVVGQALRFDSADDYVSIVGHSSFANITSSISIAYWVNVTGATEDFDAMVMRGYNGTSVPYYMDLRANLPGTGSGTHKLSWASYNGSNVGVVSSVDFSEDDNKNKWWHVTGTFDTTNGWKLYLDGVLDASSSDTTALPVNSTGITFGSFYNNGPIIRFAPIQLDDVRIYNRALTASEVLQLYALGGDKIAKTQSSSSGTGINAGLVGHWTFDGKDMLTGQARDMSGNGNHGSLVGMATSTSRTFGQIGQALKFDGVDDSVMSPAVTIGSNIATISMWANITYTILDIPLIELSTNFNNNDNTFLVSSSASATGACPANVLGIGIQSSVITGSKYRYECFARPSLGWRHFVFIIDNSTDNGDVKFYVDSVEQSMLALGHNTKDSSGNFGSHPIYIMSRAGNNLFNHGSLDDVRIYNRALTASEILQLYNMGR